MSRPATIDFETRSACSLRKSGTWTYSKHATTQVLCMAFRLPHWPKDETALWHPAFPHLDLPESRDRLDELFAWILSGELVEAHNAWFERCVWLNLMGPRYGWPAVASEQWRCSAAKAAALALPRDLDTLSVVLKAAWRKDMAGSKVMQKMSKPRKPRKKEREVWAERYGHTPHPTVWWETADLFADLFDYCRQDVLTEENVSHIMADLSDDEQAVYGLDQTINSRGFLIDAQAVRAALVLIAQEERRLNEELSILTDGTVERATQRKRMMKWFSTEGLDLFDTQATTIEDTLMRGDLSEPARRGLEILRELGRSSTAKYDTMRGWMDPQDHRVRGGLLFHGATTGRWSGSGVQPHNFPRAVAADANKKKATQEELWEHVTQGDLSWIDAHGGVMKVLSAGLRGAIVASPGKHLYVADYASIEARVLFWLANDQEMLDLFRRGEDIYCDMASQIYKKPINKHDHPNERQLGKAAILGLGYQMGWAKFVDTAKAQYGITIEDKFAQTVVETYREKRWRVKQMWGEQHEAAIDACGSSHPIRCGKVTWHREGRFVYCTLPSGRRLAYPFAEVAKREVPWGGTRDAFTYMTINTLNHQWQRQTSYGGLLVENIVQAVSRDLMADAMQRCEQSGVYAPILSVHDEVIAEAHPVLGSVKEFEQIIRTAPRWAKGCPIEVEGWAGLRYKK